jgi:hypothetical protein
METGEMPLSRNSIMRCTTAALESRAFSNALKEWLYQISVLGVTAFKYCRSRINSCVIEPPQVEAQTAVPAWWDFRLSLCCENDLVGPAGLKPATPCLEVVQPTSHALI